MSPAAPRLADYEPLLRASLEYSQDGATMDEVRAQLASGQALLWPGAASVAVTNESHEMNLWLVGGNMRELFEMEKAAAAYARARGLNRMCAEGGRPGWTRALKAIGYRQTTAMVKDI